jgi:hypothetical protein
MATTTQACDHRPSERRHILDPPSVVANTATGETNQRRVLYFCTCGKLNNVSRTAYLRVA